MNLLFAIFLAVLQIASPVSFDKTVHDWGDISISDGPVSCSFKISNVSKSPVSIKSVVSSCGCTNVSWTREPVAPGKSGSIRATYSNDETPGPFDKTLTVYLEGQKKPVLLHLRGTVHEGEVTLETSYPEKVGQLGFKNNEIKVGTLVQGEVRSIPLSFASFAQKTVSVSLVSRSPFLSVASSPVRIKPSETGEIAVTIRTDRSLWGRNTYPADVLEDGKKVGTISLWAITKEDFSGMTREERKAGERIDLEDNTFTFNPIKAGTAVEAVFRFKASPGLKIYKVDTDCAAATPGEPDISGGTLKVHYDTSSEKSGEKLILVNLYTNSPIRPVVNLFISGFVK